MHALNLRGSILLAAVAWLYIPHHVNAQQNFNVDKVQFSSSTTLPPATVVTPPAETQPTQPILLESAPAQASAAETQPIANICATPLEFLQRRNNVGTFLAAMQAAGLNDFLTSRTAVQTIFVPIDAAFNALFQSQGLTSAQLLQDTQTLTYILQNHILPNEEVRVADMVIGASWPTINPNEQLTVQTPVAPAIANGNLRACNSLIHETNVVLVPTPTPAVMATNVAPTPVAVATTTPAAATQVRLQAQARAPASFSSNLDVTKIDANFG